MNRDTHPDVLDQTTCSANVKTCGRLRQPQDHHNESAVHATIPERNKRLNSTPHGDSSYLASLRDSQESLGLSAENQNSVLRSALSMMNPHTLPSSNGDSRRNLYVLGLPFDLTKSEFLKLFEPYGTVTHAVILATLDSASRRRGFIVMSAHREAKAAMDTLSRTQIKFQFNLLVIQPLLNVLLRGHMLDVSWAVVQRSQGFLDGADRTMMLTISTPSISEPDGPYLIPGGSDDRVNSHWELTHVPTSKLLVSNLPTILFTEVSDLHPLFYPFGPIKDIKILGSTPVGAPDTTTIAMVEYVNVSSAQEAKEALQFQSYARHPIEAHYICDAGTATHSRPSPFFSGPSLGRGKSSDIGLNPFAMPFNIGSRSSAGGQTFNSRFNAAIPSGLPSDAPLAPQPFPAHMRPYVMDAISRSSSATSSTWSHDCRPLRPSRTSHSSVSRANTYTSYA